MCAVGRGSHCPWTCFWPFQNWHSPRNKLLKAMGSYTRGWECLRTGDGAMVAQPCECSKCHWVVHFKIANFILCEYHLNTLFLKTHLLQNCSIIKLTWLRCFMFSAHLSLLKAVCKSQFYTFILKRWSTIVSFCSVMKLHWFAFSKKVKTFLGGGVPGKNKSDSMLDLFLLL